MRKHEKLQLELFGARSAADVQSLGLLGWRDPLWTTRFTIILQDGTRLPMNLITIRTLHHLDLKLSRPLPPLSFAPGVLESTS